MKYLIEMEKFKEDFDINEGFFNDIYNLVFNKKVKVLYYFTSDIRLKDILNTNKLISPKAALALTAKHDLAPGPFRIALDANKLRKRWKFWKPDKDDENKITRLNTFELKDIKHYVLQVDVHASNYKDRWPEIPIGEFMVNNPKIKFDIVEKWYSYRPNQ